MLYPQTINNVSCGPESKEWCQEVADRKLDIEGEPNSVKLKKHLMRKFWIEPEYEDFAARLARYFTLVALFDEQDQEDLPEYFDRLKEIFE